LSSTELPERAIFFQDGRDASYVSSQPLLLFLVMHDDIDDATGIFPENVLFTGILGEFFQAK